MLLDKLATKAILTRIKPSKCVIKALNVFILNTSFDKDKYFVSAVFENSNGTLNFWSYIKEDLQDFSDFASLADFVYIKTEQGQLSSFDIDFIFKLYLEQYNEGSDFDKGFARQLVLYNTRTNTDVEAFF